jgi:preprotein translocase subunit SecY
MPSSRLQPLYPDRRRRGVPRRTLLLVLLVLLIAFIVYLSTMNTEVPTRHMEQDVTDALPKG